MIFEIASENDNSNSQTGVLQETEENVALKRGDRLPKSSLDRSRANDQFKVVLFNVQIKQEELNSNIRRMNDVIFEYFSRICGEVDRGGNIDLHNKYSTCTAKDPKGELKKLQVNGDDIREIKFASHMLRNLLAKKSDIASHNHDS